MVLQTIKIHHHTVPAPTVPHPDAEGKARGAVPMPSRSLSQVSFFDPEFVCPSCLVPGSVPWLLARHRSMLFPPWA